MLLRWDERREDPGEGVRGVGRGSFEDFKAFVPFRKDRIPACGRCRFVWIVFYLSSDCLEKLNEYMRIPNPADGGFEVVLVPFFRLRDE